MDTRNNTTQTTSARQIAKRLVFPEPLAPYINWDDLGTLAQNLRAHMDVRQQQGGGVEIELFWWTVGHP